MACWASWAMLLPCLALCIRGVSGRREHQDDSGTQAGSLHAAIVEEDARSSFKHAEAGSLHAAIVEEDARSSFKHAEGLESEHEFQHLAHDRSDASGWQVTEDDRQIIGEILQRLNPPGADIAFAWEEEQKDWYFGMVKLTAQTAKGSLALHMLHRHGLAPLLASRAGERFGDFLQGAARGEGEDELRFFVRSVEEFAEVKEMRDLLESLTLSGLRNFHSYDHQWSVNKWKGTVPECSQETPETCVLQACTSASAFDLLSGHGFTKQTASAALRTLESEIMFPLYTGRTGLTTDAYEQYLQPVHTGAMAPSVRVERDGSGLFIVGSVKWEDGGLTEGLKVPFSEADHVKWQGLPGEKEKSALLQAELEKWMEKQMVAHKTFMRENRLKVWAAEEAEFWEMHLAYKEATRASSAA